MKKILAFSLLGILAWVVPAHSQEGSTVQVQIDVNQAKTKKSLVAFPPLQFLGNPTTTPNYQSIGADLFRVVFNDLSVSSYFQFISQSAYLEDASKTGIRPVPAENGFKFDSWKQIGADFLVRGSFSIAGDTLNTEMYIYNVARGNTVLGKKYKGSLSTARRIAHTFSNDFMEALTGKRGMFLSKIVVASDRGGGGFKEIYTMDWDGSSVDKITNHKSVTLSPTWSPDATKVAYTAFVQRAKTKTRNADMFIYEVLTKKRGLASFRQGINSGAAYAPNGDSIYLTISQAGSPDIYKLNPNDGSLVSKITNGPRGAMNVEPAISPDGKKIAFSSDRSGKPMIYIMDIDGSNPKRITFAGDFNATPSWSPDGKRITFAGWTEGHFDVFTMAADGTDMIRITSAKKKNGKWAANEDPVYSPDGRYLMYTSNRTGSSQIYISNLDGSEERNITNDSANYFKPKWSKNIE